MPNKPKKASGKSAIVAADSTPQKPEVDRAKLQEAAEHLRKAAEPMNEAWYEIDKARDILKPFDFQAPATKSWKYAKDGVEGALSDLYDLKEGLVHVARDLALSPTENC